ncbi:PAS domain S-box protein [Oscillatoriales cyanobacterium LEGE 11467]|uniref:histidine kinase n=1 Tax=Zarconia navalis LEGE 11467 TaxID=1828826 RepID=A0A928VXB0_9CYAN|nr:ATP-binding protein [Zarconia navalis]MBE9039500.1 PAS domain S-box protein [Zarconia navalis LEGE 11467]
MPCGTHRSLATISPYSRYRNSRMDMGHNTKNARNNACDDDRDKAPEEIDFATLMQSYREISREMVLDRVLASLVQILLEKTGARSSYLLLETDRRWSIVASGTTDGCRLTVELPLAIEGQLPASIIEDVACNAKAIVLDDALGQSQNADAAYFQTHSTRSIACIPLLDGDRLEGIAYLENALDVGAFTPHRLQSVQFLCDGGATALGKARKYEEEKKRTRRLEAKVASTQEALQQERRERQLVEEKLLSSEGKMRAIFEAMTDIVLVLDVRGHEIEHIDVAPTHSARSDSYGEIVSQTINNFFDPATGQFWFGMVRRAMVTQQTIVFEYQLPIGEEEAWFSANISPMLGGSVIWVARNMSERVSAQKALHRSEEKFAKAFRSSPNPITITTMANGRHIEVNEAFCEITGYTAEEVMGQTALDLNLWVDPDERHHLFELLSTQAEVRNYEFEFRTKSGGVRTALLSTEEIDLRGEKCLLSISNDITERKQAEQELQQRNEDLAQTLQELQATQEELIQSEKMASLGQLIAGVAHEINTPMGAIRASIGNIAQALESSLQQLPHLFQTLSTERQRDFFALLELSRQQVEPLSFREERKQKRSLVKALEARGIEDRDLHSLAATLVQLGMVEPLDRFEALLKDPDRESILDVARNQAIQYKNSENIKLAIERASKIVFALKIYAHPGDSGKMTKAQVTDGIDVVLTIYQNQIKQGIEVIKNYAEVPPIFCYPSELNQVWTNLIHNAIQAMNNQGKLEISVSAKDRGVWVRITDSGCGIPADIQTKIFQPFFTTKPPGEGSGLGLDIIQKIVDKHQGIIQVESVPGQTTFSIWLPNEQPSSDPSEL